MQNNKKLAAYSGSGIVIVIIAVVLAMKGMLMQGIAVFLVGMALMFLFNRFGEEWLAKKKAEKGIVSEEGSLLEEIARRQALTERAAAQVAGGRRPLMSLIASIGSKLKDVVSPSRPFETTGEELDAIAKARAEGVDASLDSFLNEMMKDSSSLETLIGYFEAEHKAIEAEVVLMTKRVKSLSKSLRELSSARAEYSSLVRPDERIRKMKTVKDLEAKISSALKEDFANINELRKEANKVGALLHQLRILMQKMDKLAPKIKGEVEAASSRSQDFAGLKRRLEDLDKMNTSLTGNAKLYSSVVNNLINELVVVRDMIRGATHAELATERLDKQRQADEASREADRKTREIADLSTKLDAARKKVEELGTAVKNRNERINNLELLITAWERDVNSALTASKTDERLRSALAGKVNMDLVSQARVASTFMSILSDMNRELSLEKARSANLDMLLKVITEKRDALVSQEKSLEEAKKRADAQVFKIREDMDKLKAEIGEAEKKLETASEQDAVALQQRANEKRARISALQSSLNEALVAKRDIDSDQAPLKEKIEGMDKLMAEVSVTAGSIKASKSASEAKLAAAEATFKRLIALNDKQMDLIKKRKAELEAEHKQLLDAVSGIDQSILDISSVVERLRSESEVFTEAKERAVGKITAFDGKLKKAAELDQEQKKKIEELEATQKKLDEAHKKMALGFLKLTVNDRDRIHVLETESNALKENSTAKQIEAEKLKDVIAELEGSIKGAKFRIKELEIQKRSPADIDEIERLNAEVKKQEGELKDVKRQRSEYDLEASELAHKAYRNLGLLARLKEETEKAEQASKKALAELKHEIAARDAIIERRRNEIDEKRGRITELESSLKSVNEEISRLTETIFSAENPGEMRAILEDELKALDIHTKNIVKEVELRRGYEDAVTSFLNALKSLETLLNSEIEALTSRVVEETHNVERLQEEKRELETQRQEHNDRIVELQNKVASPAAEAEIRRLRGEVADKESAYGLLESQYEQASRSLLEAESDIRALHVRMPEVAARILEEERTARDAENERIRAERAAWFAKNMGPIISAIEGAKDTIDSDPHVALTQLNDALEMAEALEKVDLTSEETIELNTQIAIAKRLRGYGEQKVKAGITAVHKPYRLGVLVPFSIARHLPDSDDEYSDERAHKLEPEIVEQKAFVRQYASPDDVTGNKAPVIVLDYTKQAVTFGRMIKKQLKEQPCDVLLSEAEEDSKVVVDEVVGKERKISVISKNAFEILFEDGDYKLVSHSMYDLHFYKEKGGVKLRAETAVKLEPGDRFFLDTEELIGFEFRFIGTADAEAMQPSTWFKTVVDFQPGSAMIKPKKTEELGYLILPSHATAQLTSRSALLMDESDISGMILLRKKKVMIGKKSVNLVEKGIGVSVDDDFKLLTKKGLVPCNDMVHALHAIIWREDAGYFISDHSDFGTYVNYKRIDSKQMLSPGDVIHLGPAEPNFFIFNIKTFTPEEQKGWKSCMVDFNYNYFDSPDAQGYVGIIYAPKQTNVRLFDKSGNSKLQADNKLVLNKYLVGFGGSDKSHVEMDCATFMDQLNRPINSLLENPHFIIKREFGSAYSIQPMTEAGLLIVNFKGEQSLLGQNQMRILQDFDVIRLFDNPVVFMIFRLEERALADSDRWKRASLTFTKIDKPESYNDLKKRMRGGGIMGRVMKLIGG
jgi:chromosome segregation ATPase